MNPPNNKVVLDTNIFVAFGFNKRSSSAKIIQAVKDKRLILIWNNPTFQETKMIVSKIPPLSWKEFEDLFQPRHKYHQRLTYTPYGFIPDPDDRKFAALAVATQANLVSNDDHLLAHANQIDTPVMPAGKAYKQLLS